MTTLPAPPRSAVRSAVRFPNDRLPGRCCPACGADGLRAFYEVAGVPVQSNLLVHTAAEAEAFPTGDVRLALCETCGFVTNAAFDERRLMMSQAYEASQAASGTFNAFAKGLAERWAKQYDLAGKTVVEIGCGQGEFLELLCGVAHCRGIGFDPVVRRERSERYADVIFVPDRFEPYAGQVHADLIVCRHTLEHIAEPLAFLTAVREAAPDTPLAFEVPDTRRVLEGGAFWDIYYEHNSYFTAESLTRVFQRAGYEVRGTTLEFGDQYLTIDAVPTGGQKRDMPTLTELRLASQFARVGQMRLHEWQNFADDAVSSGKRCVIWGSGSKAVGFLTSTAAARAFASVIDINPAKQGSYLPGTRLRIDPPETLRGLRPDSVVIMNAAYRAEITRDLARTGLSPQVLALD